MAVRSATLKFIACMLLFFAGCKPHPLEIEGMNSASSHRLTPNIVVHQTSGVTYTLCDGDGFGLIDGSLVKLFYQKSDGLLIVSYVPSNHVRSDVNKIPDSDTNIAIGWVDSSGRLKDGKMEVLSSQGIKGKYTAAIRQMKSVESIFP